MIRNTVIRCGNHWLLSDDMKTKLEWISDRATASRHTRKWAERFAREQLTKHNTRVELFSVEEAQKLADHDRQQRLHASYFYAMDAEVRRLAPDRTFHIPGVGCSSVCFAATEYESRGVNAKRAAREFLKTHKGRPLKKRRAVSCS